VSLHNDTNDGNDFKRNKPKKTNIATSYNQIIMTERMERNNKTKDKITVTPFFPLSTVTGPVVGSPVGAGVGDGDGFCVQPVQVGGCEGTGVGAGVVDVGDGVGSVVGSGVIVVYRTAYCVILVGSPLSPAYPPTINMTEALYVSLLSNS